ncbi:uncharacterized protein LOC115888766 [Sitophilus oryzae]|uniref:Uncharacterized protein LOC115888766 n=1 Tax=Sitophilus oryzae TaxID=7048 RepID=A0A6J2YMM4_SITOR|nr:uncharacterized protein LOC115888766 [Sitophilus oryzae]
MVETQRIKPKIVKINEESADVDADIEDMEENTFEIVEYDQDDAIVHSDIVEEPPEALSERSKLEDILENMSTTINVTVVELVKSRFETEEPIDRSQNQSCSLSDYNGENNREIDLNELLTNIEKLVRVNNKLVWMLKIVLFVFCLNAAVLVKSTLF